MVGVDLFRLLGRRVLFLDDSEDQKHCTHYEHDREYQNGEHSQSCHEIPNLRADETEQYHQTAQFQDQLKKTFVI